MPGFNVENLAKNITELGEGPHWDHEKNRLLLVDITKSTIQRWDAATEKLQEPIIVEDPTIGAVVPRASGGLVVAASHRFAWVNEETGKVETIVKATENEKCRFNDGKCDPSGRFWAGTMGLESKPAVPIPTQGEMFLLNTDLKCSKKFSKLEISNGMAWNQENSRMFYIDSLKYNIVAFKYDHDTGDIADPQTVVDFVREEHGTPDGQTIDADGNLWVAMFGKGHLLKVDTTAGKIVERVKISDTALKTTSCCFGGPDYTDLYVTSAVNWAEEPTEVGESGSLFRVRGLGVRGLPAVPFKG